MADKIDMTGMCFNRLTVISLVRTKPRRSWSCKCSCGSVVVVDGGHIRSGHTKSCGCHNAETKVRANTKHGMSKSTESSIFFSMKNRCLNERSIDYSSYGGRGIKICDRWLGDNGFSNFLQDMGPRPSRSMTLDRINNNEGYSPENCRWASKHQQANNKRNNVIIVYAGVADTISNWSRLSGVYVEVIRKRLRRGWTVDDAILIPAGVRR